MPYIVFCNYIRIAFLIRCALRFMISCLLGCVLLSKVSFFYFFPIHSECFLHSDVYMLYIIRTTCDVFFCPMCLMFCFVLSIGIAFSSDLLYVLYCHIHSGSILLAHVSYVLFCLWPFGYLSPSDVS